MRHILGLCLVVAAACTSSEHHSPTCDTTVTLLSTMNVADTKTTSIAVPGTTCLMLGNTLSAGDTYSLTVATSNSGVQLEMLDAATGSSMSRGMNSVTFQVQCSATPCPAIPSLVWVNATASTTLSTLDLTLTALFHAP